MDNANKNTTEQIIAILKQKSVLRPRDLDAYKIPRRYLSRLHHRGLLVRSARGIYTAVNAELSENQTVVEVSKRVPQGTVCLLSALSIHEMTTQFPFDVWLAIDRKGWLPKVKDLPIKTVRFSGEALTKGIDYHIIDGVKVPVYNPAKTIADCFKYRNKIGLDVAIEALKEGWKDKKFNMNDMWKYSKICRVQNVMRPYLESLSS
ncbi:MAG: type IV toxin-antitoxin system AbiEi family antitoxin domain-containing protein [Mariprofundaceae bacterium]|nr:type IV toxin-antitoxin system AbiEi family antitoxin domain-containing protein [Mariprofundaceae bacterium]